MPIAYRQFSYRHLLAQVYTELNATSKGVSLGIYDAEKLKPGAGSAQPFVDIMGRKVFTTARSPTISNI